MVNSMSENCIPGLSDCGGSEAETIPFPFNELEPSSKRIPP